MPQTQNFECMPPHREHEQKMMKTKVAVTVFRRVFDSYAFLRKLFDFHATVACGYMFFYDTNLLFNFAVPR